MWDFIKLLCVEGNGSAWVDAAVMTSAKGDQFVLSNLCHLSAPTQQPVLKTRAGEAETEKITLDNKVLSAEPSSDRERPVEASPLLLSALGAHRAAPAPGCQEELGAQEMD